MSEEQKKFNFLKALKETILKKEKPDGLEPNSQDAEIVDTTDSKQLFVKSVSPNQEDESLYKFKGISAAQELDIRFAENFVDSGGKFIFAENMLEVVQLLESLKKEHQWNHVFPIELELKNLLNKFGFQSDSDIDVIDDSSAAISFCYSLSADEGVIILTPEEATSRKLSTFPENHIIIAFKNQLKPNIEKAVLGFQDIFNNRLPSVLELYPEKPVSRTYHKMLLNAEGPKNVFLFYIDSDLG